MNRESESAAAISQSARREELRATADRSGDAAPASGMGLIWMANVVVRHRRVILGVPTALVLLTALPKLLGDRDYTSEAAFMPQQAEVNSSLAGLASQFGFATGIPGSEQSAAFYAEFLNSYTLLHAIVSESYEFESGGRRYSGSYADLQDVDEGPPARRLELSVRDLRERTTVRHSRETGIVRLLVRTEWPEFSKMIADRMLLVVNEFNLNNRQTQAAAERRFVQGRLAEVQQELRAAEEALKDFLEQNRQFRSAELQVEQERLENEVMMTQQVVTSLRQSFEQARIDEVRNTPLITIIQEPTRPALPDRRGLIRETLVAGVLGLLIGLFLAVTLEAFRRQRDIETSEYAQLRQSIRSTFGGLQNPLRRIRARSGS